MAINSARSMNQDLYLGSQVDGRFKTLTPDRGGEVDETAVRDRAWQLQAQYAITDMGHSYACTCPSCST